jgi:hypothetical protein
MSVIALLERELGPLRVTLGDGGQLVTFEHGGRWRTLRLIERPRIEASIAVPELAAYQLRLRFGLPSLLGDGGGHDPHWELRTRDPGVAAALLAGWPPPPPPPPRDDVESVGTRMRALGVGLLGLLTYGIVQPRGARMRSPLPRYALELAGGTASIQRPFGELDAVRGAAMVGRLLQVATWPDRARGALGDLAVDLDGRLLGDRWAPGTTAVELARGPVAIRIDHAVSRRALQTRIVARGHVEAEHRLDGVVTDPGLVGSAIDALVARVASPRVAAGPYR